MTEKKKMEPKKRSQLTLAVGILFLLVVAAAWLVYAMLQNSPGSLAQRRTTPVRITRKVPQPPPPPPPATTEQSEQPVMPDSATATGEEIPPALPLAVDAPDSVADDGTVQPADIGETAAETVSLETMEAMETMETASLPAAPAESPPADRDSTSEAQPQPTVAGETAQQPPVTVDAPAVYTVQVGAFLRESNALRFEKRLKETGYTAYIKHHNTTKGRQWYLVRLGDFDRYSDAKATMQAFRRKENLPAIITPIDSITPVRKRQ